MVGMRIGKAYSALAIARKSAPITFIWQELKSRLRDWESFTGKKKEASEIVGGKKLHSSSINIPQQYVSIFLNGTIYFMYITITCHRT